MSWNLNRLNSRVRIAWASPRLPTTQSISTASIFFSSGRASKSLYARPSRSCLGIGVSSARLLLGLNHTFFGKSSPMMSPNTPIST